MSPKKIVSVNGLPEHIRNYYKGQFALLGAVGQVPQYKTQCKKINDALVALKGRYSDPKDVSFNFTFID